MVPQVRFTVVEDPVAWHSAETVESNVSVAPAATVTLKRVPVEPAALFALL